MEITGLLHDSRIFIAWMASRRTSLLNSWIYFNLFIVGCAGIRAGSLAIENGVTVRMDDDKTVLFRYNDFK